MMSGPGPYTATFLRRVRAWPVPSWRSGRREAAAGAGLDALAGLAATADGRPRPPVPAAGPHALADQFQVLVADALAAGADALDVDAVLRGVAAELGLRVN